MMETKVERRTAARQPCKFLVRYFYLPPEANPPSTCTIDMSTQGACVEAVDLLPSGASIAFLLITQENQVIDVRARVVHTEAGQPQAYRAGVSFTWLSPSDHLALQHAISVNR
jgi:hypothetical protein